MNRLRNLLRPPLPEPGTIPKNFIRQYLPANPVIVEAGAHVGQDTAVFAREWKDAQIHAFEPVPEIWKQLVRNTGELPNVYCYPFAVSRDPDWSWSTIHVSSGTSDASSSILKPKLHLEVHPSVTFTNSIQMPSISLDQWAKTWHVAKVDFIWLDLQGFEHQALLGAEEMLQNVSAVVCEVNLIETYEGASLYPELKSWLESRGFRVEREEIPWNDAGNVFFVRNV